MSLSFSMFTQLGEETISLSRIEDSDSFQLPVWHAPGKHKVFMILGKSNHSLTFSEKGARQGYDFKHFLGVRYTQVTVFLKIQRNSDGKYFTHDVESVCVDRCCLRYDPKTMWCFIECEDIAQGSIDDVNKKTKSDYADMINAAVGHTLEKQGGKKVTSRTI